MITEKELERFFINEIKWVEQRILIVAKRSNFPVISSSPHDCLDLIGDIWLILSKERNLEVMRNDSDIRGKTNNIIYLLLNKTNSKYIRNKNFKNEKMDGYITSCDLATVEEDGYNSDDYNQKLDLIDDTFARFNLECDNIDSILFDLYYTRSINSVTKLANHLSISRQGSYSMIKRLKAILEYMIVYSDSYEDAKKKIQDMKEVKKNKWGIFEEVYNDSDMNIEDVADPIDDYIEDEVIEEEEEIDIDEDIDKEEE